jgi:MFS family permease
MTFGFSLAVLGSQLDKLGFLAYFNLDLVNPQKIDHTNSILAAFNCLLYVGGWIGSLSMGTLADRFGRRIAIALGAGLVVLGGALQAGSVAQAMFCVARIVTGLGVGILLGAVPLFQAEISPPHSRGLMVGFHGRFFISHQIPILQTSEDRDLLGLGVFLGAGLAIAQWIGLAFYNVQGQGAWRGPLAIQCIFPLVLLCGIFFLPESPRYRKSFYLNIPMNGIDGGGQCTRPINMNRL